MSTADQLELAWALAYLEHMYGAIDTVEDCYRLLLDTDMTSLRAKLFRAEWLRAWRKRRRP